MDYGYFNGRKDILWITYLDVGHGDAALIRTPTGKIILVDAGNTLTGYSKDYGKEVVVPYLKSQNIKKIDIIIASHPHEDHIGGFIAVLKSFEIGIVYDIGIEYPSPVYKTFLKSIDSNGTEYRLLKAGYKLKFDNKLNVQVLNPLKKYEKLNDNSIVFRIIYGNVSFLFTGDIEREAEREIVRSYGKIIKSDFLKSPHHGSRSSSTPKFLDAVLPAYVIISSEYNHPAIDTIKMYNRYAAKILRTDYNGNIDIKTDGEKYAINVEKRIKEDTRIKSEININYATINELQDLPGIGAGTARRIVEYRQKNGYFKSKSDVLKIRGVGYRTFERIKEYIVLK